MTLYGLNKRGLVDLPVLWLKHGTEDSYYNGHVDGLRLLYTKNWGKDGEDDAITLFCEDIATDTQYSADIRDVAEELNKDFILGCLIDSYGHTIREVFSSRLRLDKRGKKRVSTFTLLHSRLLDYLEM